MSNLKLLGIGTVTEDVVVEQVSLEARPASGVELTLRVIGDFINSGEIVLRGVPYNLVRPRHGQIPRVRVTIEEIDPI